jgi:hypothetical protein
VTGAETFDGATFDPALDGDRLRSQLARVRRAMADGEWHTLRELGERLADSDASVSARLRDLRKPKFGGWTVERQRVPGGNGLHRYRLAPPPGQLF